MHLQVAGDGPDLVLIHGASGSLREFTFALMDRLAAEYRVIAVDSAGAWPFRPDGKRRREPWRAGTGLAARRWQS